MSQLDNLNTDTAIKLSVVTMADFYKRGIRIAVSQIFSQEKKVNL